MFRYLSSGWLGHLVCFGRWRLFEHLVGDGEHPHQLTTLSRLLHAGALHALGLSAGDLRRHRFIGATQDDDLVELAVLVSL